MNARRGDRVPNFDTAGRKLLILNEQKCSRITDITAAAPAYPILARYGRRAIRPGRLIAAAPAAPWINQIVTPSPFLSSFDATRKRLPTPPSASWGPLLSKRLGSPSRFGTLLIADHCKWKREIDDPLASNDGR
jgi:hypothetical protein